ncbi:hypothetical protein K440DRAFT_665251 [Wilcoxina mikolae CBS 423.85]|nr:hypothetical protein K440DRAFT_665251 [Wilcoxina mikolae CBS 423.85]
MAPRNVKPRVGKGRARIRGKTISVGSPPPPPTPPPPRPPPSQLPEAVEGPISATAPPMPCPILCCTTVFASKNPLRAITLHLKKIVDHNREYYALKPVGMGYWDAHKKEYDDRAAARASSKEKQREAQRKYREANREKRSQQTKLSQARAKARKEGLTGEEMETRAIEIRGLIAERKTTVIWLDPPDGLDSV